MAGCSWVKSPPQHHSKASGDVLDPQKVALGRGGEMISPSASLLQAMLYVGSTTRVLEVPMDMCGVYRNNCDSCLLARDPYCGWFNGSCQSVYLTRWVAAPAPPDPNPWCFPFLARALSQSSRHREGRARRARASALFKALGWGWGGVSPYPWQVFKLSAFSEPLALVRAISAALPPQG